VKFTPVTGAGTNMLDPNGNEMNITETYDSNIGVNLTKTTDTLGRIWSQTDTTDFTHCPVAASGAYVWTIPGPNGATSTFKFCYSTLNIQTHFNISGYTEYTGTAIMLTGVVLPNLTTWRFDYNSYGDVAKITFPTGGFITYGWSYSLSGCGGPNQGPAMVTSSHSIRWHKHRYLDLPIGNHHGPTWK
jgi:YD repeat-containing protein